MSGFDQQWFENYNKKLNDKNKDISHRKKVLKVKKVSKEKEHIEMVLSTLKIPYEKEFRFCAERKFRSDWAIPSMALLIEYEGLFSAKSRHTTPTGFSNDTRKYNLATTMGFRILRYTPLTFKELIFDLQKLLKDTK